VECEFLTQKGSAKETLWHVIDKDSSMKQRHDYASLMSLGRPPISIFDKKINCDIMGHDVDANHEV
jgi:hypothetical protein